MNHSIKGRSKFLLSHLTSAIFLATCSQTTFAGAFSLYNEANGRNAGDFAAGAAAEASDASTLFYNPAGLVELEGQQLVIGGTLVHVKAKLSDDATLRQNVQRVPVPGTLSLAGIDTKNTAVIPSFFYAKKVNPNLSWGIGLNVPFGLATDWGDTNDTRYDATLSELRVINLSPAFAARLSDDFSFGAGFDIQYATVDINSMAGLISVPAIDSESKNHGSSIGFGAHAGILYKPNSRTKFGFNYQSRVSHEFTGYSELVGPTATPNPDRSDDLRSDPTSMPDQLTLSGTYQYTPKLTLMGTAAYVRWNSIPEISMRNVASINGQRIDVTLPENFKNTVKLAAGMKYKVNDKWLIRFGAGYDQSPVNSTDRNLRLPDDDHYAIAVGGHYKATKTIGLDFGWTHLFVKNTRINHTTNVGANSIMVNAGVKSAVDLLGGQITWQIS